LAPKKELNIACILAQQKKVRIVENMIFAEFAKPAKRLVTIIQRCSKRIKMLLRYKIYHVKYFKVCKELFQVPNS